MPNRAFQITNRKSKKSLAFLQKIVRENLDTKNTIILHSLSKCIKIVKIQIISIFAFTSDEKKFYKNETNSF